jgi:hypothetical protein
LESPPFPYIGCKEGTRNAIAMSLMTLGLVETVKLLPGYEWVRVLRCIEREQRCDIQKRKKWWSAAEAIAQQLHKKYHVGGVGVIGGLLESRPLNDWSTIDFIVWDCSERLPHWQIQQENALPIRVSDIADATPAQWLAIEKNMSVLVGEWHAQERPNSHQRCRFYWLNESE